MENSFISYLEHLKLIAFFAGYPIVYSIVYSVSGNAGMEKNAFRKNVSGLLPCSYACIGTLFLGYQLRGFYEKSSIGIVTQHNLHPYLVAWGLLSILFWLPLMRKRTTYSLVHSMVFLFLLGKYLFPAFSTQIPDNRVQRNSITIYGISVLLNALTFLAVLFVSYIRYRTRKKHLR
jgi:hypothetical protein